jgi:hypothetical protein
VEIVFLSDSKYFYSDLFFNPGQVIMLGASRNSFRVDHQGALVSTDALLKLAHPLGNMLRTNKWLPKRSLTFSFWGGAEFGDIGRTEHMEVCTGYILFHL